MHPDEKANWQRIKKHLEEVEQTLLQPGQS